MYNKLVLSDNNYILDVCFHQFLLILTYHNSDDKENLMLLKNSIRSGKILLRNYINNLINKEYLIYKNRPSYSVWLNDWTNNNPKFASCLEDDGFYSTLGVKLLEILENCDMINKILITVSRTEKHYELTISNDKFLTSLKTNKIYCLPTKLPM